MILMQHDFENRTDSSEEAIWNIKIAMLAFVAALFMMKYTRGIHDFFAVKHNRAVVDLRHWRYLHGWRR